MSDPVRISVSEAHQKLQAGESFLLVCAYPNDAMFQKAPLEGAISFSEFENRRSSLSPNQEIAFY